MCCETISDGTEICHLDCTQQFSIQMSTFSPPAADHVPPRRPVLHQLPHQHHHTVEAQCRGRTCVQRLWPLHEAAWGRCRGALCTDFDIFYQICFTFTSPLQSSDVLPNRVNWAENNFPSKPLPKWRAVHYLCFVKLLQGHCGYCYQSRSVGGELVWVVMTLWPLLYQGLGGTVN